MTFIGSNANETPSPRRSAGPRGVLRWREGPSVPGPPGRPPPGQEVHPVSIDHLFNVNPEPHRGLTDDPAGHENEVVGLLRVLLRAPKEDDQRRASSHTRDEVLADDLHWCSLRWREDTAGVPRAALGRDEACRAQDAGDLLALRHRRREDAQGRHAEARRLSRGPSV